MSTKKSDRKILSFNDFISKPTQLVEAEIAELGGSVFLKPLTAGDMVDYLHTQRKEATDEDKANGTLIMLTKCVVNPDGSRLFADVPLSQLRDLPAPIFSRLISLSNEVNGVQKGADEAVGKD